jgi:hypothetical protein
MMQQHAGELLFGDGGKDGAVLLILLLLLITTAAAAAVAGLMHGLDHQGLSFDKPAHTQQRVQAR